MVKEQKIFEFQLRLFFTKSAVLAELHVYVTWCLWATLFLWSSSYSFVYFSDFLFKFLVIGSAGTGKSCILHQFIEGKCKFRGVFTDKITKGFSRSTILYTKHDIDSFCHFSIRLIFILPLLLCLVKYKWYVLRSIPMNWVLTHITDVQSCWRSV